MLTSPSSTREAFADAAAGVAGSLVAMLTFYPLDVLKTNLQASTTAKDKDKSKRLQSKSPLLSFQKRKAQILTLAYLKSVFRGLHYKTAHTFTSSFTYFFIYSFVKAQHKAYCLKSSSKNGGAFKYQPSTTARLLLSALAGMVNVTLTFPLDVLAARSQTATATSAAESAEGGVEGVEGVEGEGAERAASSAPFEEEKEHQFEKKRRESSDFEEYGQTPCIQNKTNNTYHETHSHHETASHTTSNKKLLQLMDQVWDHDTVEKNQNNNNNSNNNHNHYQNAIFKHASPSVDDAYDTADDDLSYDYNQNNISFTANTTNTNSSSSNYNENPYQPKGSFLHEDTDDDGLSYSDHYTTTLTEQNVFYDDNTYNDDDGQYHATDDDDDDEVIEVNEEEEKKNDTLPSLSYSTNNRETSEKEFKINHRLLHKSKPCARLASSSLSSLSTCLHSNKNNSNNDSSSITPSSSSSSSKREIMNNILELWSGIQPALLLCSNPAINFTVFDVVKEQLLHYKKQQLQQRRRRQPNQQHGSSTISDKNNIRIYMMEAFIIGLIAKFAATIATYPLIRAKVMLMVADSKKKKKDHKECDDSNNTVRDRKNDGAWNNEYNNNDYNNDNNSNSKQEEYKSRQQKQNNEDQSMVSVLYDIFIQEGIQGLYKGCRLQLIHTMLKSALLMMVRERINVTTHRLIVGNS